MRFLHLRRRRLHLVVAAILVAQIVALAAGALPAQAATSAEPSEEIVYIDSSGVIRVLDTQGDQLVQWFSPTGGWGWIALGDVNDDKDLEILALARDGANTRVAVFDPVAASGATDPNKKINGIPWDTLYEPAPFPGEAQFIYSGDYDTGIPGDEFIIGYRNEAIGLTFIEIWNAQSLAANGKPTGRDWKLHIQKSFAEPYEFATSGQMIEGGTEEVFLFDRDSKLTRFDVFRPELDFERIDGKKSDNDAYRMAALGQIREGGNEETAIIASASRPDKASLLVYETSGDLELETDEDWAFAPQPEFVFLADISGNDDEEVFILRKYPEGDEGARLIMRDEWGDDRDRHPEIEIALMANGSKNEFRVGAGGDTDGDGKDEVVILPRRPHPHLYTARPESRYHVRLGGLCQPLDRQR